MVGIWLHWKLINADQRTINQRLGCPVSFVPVQNSLVIKLRLQKNVFVKSDMIKLFSFDVGTWNSPIWTANWSEVSLFHPCSYNRQLSR